VGADDGNLVGTGVTVGAGVGNSDGTVERVGPIDGAKLTDGTKVGCIDEVGRLDGMFVGGSVGIICIDGNGVPFGMAVGCTDCGEARGAMDAIIKSFPKVDKKRSRCVYQLLTLHLLATLLFLQLKLWFDVGM
jgi:hypothetical protein